MLLGRKKCNKGITKQLSLSLIHGRKTCLASSVPVCPFLLSSKIVRVLGLTATLAVNGLENGVGGRLGSELSELPLKIESPSSSEPAATLLRLLFFSGDFLTFVGAFFPSP